MGGVAESPARSVAHRGALGAGIRAHVRDACQHRRRRGRDLSRAARTVDRARRPLCLSEATLGELTHLHQALLLEHDAEPSRLKSIRAKSNARAGYFTSR